MTQAMCTSFKGEIFRAQHNFSASGGDTFKIALATSGVTLDATTTNYTALSGFEVTSSGYTGGGFSLTNVDSSTSGMTGMQTFASNPSWNAVSFTASQALLYNSTQGGKAVAVLDFGGSQGVAVGTFTINLPPVTATTALLRIL